METNMNAPRKIYLLAMAMSIAGCASNEELFAEYDAYCQGSTCTATQVEVVYEQVPVAAETMLWEPAIYFGYDLSVLDPGERVRLDRNIEVLNTDSSLKISLQAFTDSVASFAYNARLAERRRIAVVDYLVDSGIAEDRIVSSSGSESLPVLPSDSAADRVVNRRVEMMLLNSDGRPLSVGIAVPDTPEDFVPPYPEVKPVE
jgi:outer membrane protein OmpA-like peptidoglycan-associated protein